VDPKGLSSEARPDYANDGPVPRALEGPGPAATAFYNLQLIPNSGLSGLPTFNSIIMSSSQFYTFKVPMQFIESKI